MDNTDHSLKPVLAAIAGIALYSAMDALMKGASLAIGGYSAFLLRNVLGFLVLAPLFWWRIGKMPRREVLRIHLIRGTVLAFMGWTFFASLVLLPLAEAIAISFIAPLVALYLAAILLGEEIRPSSVGGSLLGLLGVLIIVGGRIGRENFDRDAMIGVALVLVSALLYAWNLILQRQQALAASPLEAATFQSGIISVVLGVGAPFLLVLPGEEVWQLLAQSGALAVSAAMLFTWAYARSETQRLVPIEYTAFLWAAALGWYYFDEPIRPATLIGAVTIVIGCWIATRRHSQPTEQTAL